MTYYHLEEIEAGATVDEHIAWVNQLAYSAEAWKDVAEGTWTPEYLSVDPDVTYTVRSFDQLNTRTWTTGLWVGDSSGAIVHLPFPNGSLIRGTDRYLEPLTGSAGEALELVDGDLQFNAVS